MNEEKTFSQLLKDSLESHNITYEKLSELTGVPTKYLTAIEKNNLAKLPPAPYVRGYIRSISTTLELDGDYLWKVFQQESQLAIAGQKDRMPGNRFAKKPINKSFAFGVFMGLLALTYLGYRINSLTGYPNLTISYPNAPTTIINTGTATLVGKVDPNSKLIIGNERVNVESDGSWEKKITLEPGLNSIEIKAQKLLGRELTETRQIIYTPVNSSSTKTPEVPLLNQSTNFNNS